MISKEERVSFSDPSGQWVFTEYSIYYISFKDLIHVECNKVVDHWELHIQYSLSKSIISLSSISDVTYILKRIAAYKNGVHIKGVPIVEE